MRQHPVLTAQEEAAIVARQAAAKRLGIKAERRYILCPRCGNNYIAGSGHRGSLWCDGVHLSKLLRERGLTSISFAYLSRIKETGAPYEIHNTRMTYYFSVGTKRPYKSTNALDEQLWVPREIAAVFRKTAVAMSKRIALAREVVAINSATWRAAEIGAHGRQE